MHPQTIDLIKSIIEILSALLTPAIGIIGAIIIVFQYRLASLRWRLDLFDKRYPVYLSTQEYITSIVSLGYMNLTDEIILKFLRGSKDYDFLFGKDVKDYLNVLYKKGLKLQLLSRRLSNIKISDDERDKTITEIGLFTDWFSNQYDESNKLFSKYLKIDKK